MKRRQRFALSKFERRTIAEDPELDRLLRYGLPPARQRRRYRMLTLAGAVVLVTSLFASYPIGILAGLAAVAVGLHQLNRLRKQRGFTGLSAIENHLHEKGFS